MGLSLNIGNRIYTCFLSFLIAHTYPLNFDFTFCGFSDMSATAFIEPLPVIDFVGQLLKSEIHSRPLSDAERVKVLSLNYSFPDISSHRDNHCSNEMLCIALKIKKNVFLMVEIETVWI